MIQGYVNCPDVIREILERNFGDARNSTLSSPKFEQVNDSRVKGAVEAIKYNKFIVADFL